MMPESHLKGKT